MGTFVKKDMKTIRLSLVLALVSLFYSCEVKAQVNPTSTYVSGYTRGDGTYVSGYYKTTPNNTN
jgi:transglutaminase-like putative cysteine protease